MNSIHRAIAFCSITFFAFILGLAAGITPEGAIAPVTFVLIVLFGVNTLMAHNWK